LDEAEDEEESEAIVNQVLDEIGISLDQSLPNATGALPSSGKQAAPQEKQAQALGGEEDDLQARLDQLRKGDDDEQ
jgi:charged multivesicular body protein 2A